MFESINNVLPYIFSLIVGLAVGSFLNVVIYRAEKNKSLAGRSYCPKCQKQLLWRDNIPLFSYFLLGGRCRFCRKKISAQYPAVEALTGVTYLGVTYLLLNNYWNNWLSHYFSMAGILTLSEKYNKYIPLVTLDAGLKMFETFLVFAVFSVLIAILVYDFKHMLIPDAYTVAGIIIATAFNLFSDAWLLVSILSSKNQMIILKINEFSENLAKLNLMPKEILETFGIMIPNFYTQAIHLKALFLNMNDHPYLNLFLETKIVSGLVAGLLAAAFFYFIVWVSKETWMGMGDVKLAFFLGLLLGGAKTLVALFVAFQIGALVGLLLIALGRAKMKTALPFGPFMIIGAGIALLFP